MSSGPESAGGVGGLQPIVPSPSGRSAPSGIEARVASAATPLLHAETSSPPAPLSGRAVQSPPTMYQSVVKYLDTLFQGLVNRLSTWGERTYSEEGALAANRKEIGDLKEQITDTKTPLTDTDREALTRAITAVEEHLTTAFPNRLQDATADLLALRSHLPQIDRDIALIMTALDISKLRKEVADLRVGAGATDTSMSMDETALAGERALRESANNAIKRWHNDIDVARAFFQTHPIEGIHLTFSAADIGHFPSSHIPGYHNWLHEHTRRGNYTWVARLEKLLQASPLDRKAILDEIDTLKQASREASYYRQTAEELLNKHPWTLK